MRILAAIVYWSLVTLFWVGAVALVALMTYAIITNWETSEHVRSGTCCVGLLLFFGGLYALADWADERRKRP